MALTSEQETIISDGMAAGLSRNEISRRAGCSARSVDLRAKRTGHTWDRAAPAAAVAAAQFDHAQRRTQLREKALILMERLYEQAITQPHDPKEAADMARAIMAAVNADAKLAEQDRTVETPPILLAVKMLSDAPERLPGE